MTRNPPDGFLHKTMELCHRNGAVFILDENITGFRWHLGGAQKYYDIVPDLSTFGKAIANGFALSALAGKRELMDLGGIHHDKERVFLLSTTHGAETHALAAAIATIEVYENEPVIEHLHRQGARLARGFRQASASPRPERICRTRRQRNATSHISPAIPRESRRKAFRSLFLQELIKRGVLAPSLVVSYSHSDEDIDRTIDAIDGALAVYKQAMEDGVDHIWLVPPPASCSGNTTARRLHLGRLLTSAIPTDVTSQTTASCPVMRTKSKRSPATWSRPRTTSRSEPYNADHQVIAQGSRLAPVSGVDPGRPAHLVD